jgi:hypothetical protein
MGGPPAPLTKVTGEQVSSVTPTLEIGAVPSLSSV